MNTGIIIALTFLIGFLLGVGFGRASKKRSGSAYLLRTLVVLIAIIFSVLGLAGVIQFASPSFFIGLSEKLPEDIRSILLADLLLGGTRLWIFAVVAGVLWWAQSKIK